MEFEIVPFVGVENLRFGMTPQQVADILGAPSSIGEGYYGERQEYRTDGNDLLVTYDEKDNTAVHFGFWPKMRGLSFKEKKLFQMPELEALAVLIKEDDSPYEVLGIINFLGLGITMSGFHEEDPSQKAVAVYKSGDLDSQFGSIKKHAIPFKLP
ncbi:MAG: outer membrane protein assembly factor BamE [Zoogloeaceae bacterium]|nr:outer membrane protein assembly factor BamE [Zoogloeaceae bacterium]